MFDAETAEKLLVEAVERVERNASSEWLTLARDAILLIAQHRQTFTTDSVWAILARWNVEEPHESRAIGAAMRRAQSAGWCKPTEQVSHSIRPACHRRPLRVWQSLVYNSAGMNLNHDFNELDVAP